MALDEKAFEAEDFDAPSWLNARLASRRASDGGTENATASSDQEEEEGQVIKYLGELEVKLQLVTDDLGMKIEYAAKSAAERLPLARKEMLVLQQQTGALRRQIVSIVGNVTATQSTLGHSMGNLQLIDRVQTNMRMARDALSEAAGLAQLLATVEQTFRQGELPTIARQLKQIRESLESVKGLPEFAGVETRLREFEERLQGMIQSPLQKAFEEHDAKTVQRLSEVLVMTSKQDIVGSLFVAAKMPALQTSWESFSPAGRTTDAADTDKRGAEGRDAFHVWLPVWLEVVVATAKTEFQWCSDHLHGQAGFLVATMLEAFFISIKHAFRNRLQTQLSQCQLGADIEASETTPMSVLGEVKASLAAFVKAVAAILRSSKAAPQAKANGAGAGADPSLELSSLIEGVVLCVYGQIKDHVMLYPSLEKQYMASVLRTLSSQLDAPSLKLVPSQIKSPSELAEAIEGCVGVMDEITHQAFEACSGALPRCLDITSGFKVADMLDVLDAALATFAKSLGGCVQRIHNVISESRAGSGGVGGLLSGGREASSDGAMASDAAVGEALPENVLVAILRVLQVAAIFSKNTRVLESRLHASLTALRSDWRDEDHEVHVLYKLFPGQDVVLGGKVDALLGDASSLLPTSDVAVRGFDKACDKLIVDLMVVRVKQSLAGLAESTLWSKGDAKDKTFDLPSFSSFPSKHVTALGEYLLVLPQQFEVLDDMAKPSPTGSSPGGEEETSAGEGGAGSPHVAASEWIARVVSEAARLYTTEVLRIRTLSRPGCMQLQADVDYLGNILQALFVSIPAPLATIATNLQVTDEELGARLATKPAPSGCDEATWMRLVEMRTDASVGAGVAAGKAGGTDPNASK